jgi:hypothetical protein
LKAKQQKLVRDLAKLLAKYSTRDWEPIVRLLRAGKSKIPQLTAAIEDLGKTNRKRRSEVTSQGKKAPAKKSSVKRKKKALKGTAKRKPRSLKSSKKADSESHAADQHLEAWTKAMLAGSPTSELQELYFKAVGSKRVPIGRDAVIRALVDFLKRGSIEQRRLFINLLQRRSYDATEDYRRWTAMISRLRTSR